MRMRWRFVGTMVLLAALAPAGVHGQERYAVGGDHVAIYNLAGEIEVVGSPSGQVTVDVTRGGRDGGELRVEAGRIADRQVLRVVYPARSVVYSSQRWRGTTRMSVRPDGTWGGDRGAGGGTVQIRSRGRGLEAWADLRVGVPRGQRVDLFLGVGRIVAENVDGAIYLHSSSGAVDAAGLSGSARIRTGSGRVQVEGMDGPLTVTTGSGRVQVRDVAGDSVSIRTGSGRVTGDDVRAHRLQVRTGSGRVQFRHSAARQVDLHTGSGGVTAELLDPVDQLRVRTGSGGVRLRLSPDLDAEVVVGTGSGRVTLDFPMHITRQARRELRGVIGAGTGSIRVNTGSGRVRLERH